MGASTADEIQELKNEGFPEADATKTVLGNKKLKVKVKIKIKEKK